VKGNGKVLTLIVILLAVFYRMESIEGREMTAEKA